MAKDDTPTLARQRAKRLIRDLQEGPFAVLAFPDGDDENIRIYASGLDAQKLRRIEQFIEAIINE